MEQIALENAFFKEHLRKAINEIYNKQRAVGLKKMEYSGPSKAKSRGESLRDAINHPHYKLASDIAGAHVTMFYPISMRFVDMKHLNNWRIYNKPIWRTFYKKIFSDMRFEFSDWLKTQTAEAIRKACQPLI